MDTLSDKVLARTDRSGECWIWQGYTAANGYGMVRDAAKRTRSGKTGQSLVHRVVYEAVNGPLPAGAHVHHQCAEKRCVNPAHLRACTPKEHRSVHAGAITHCPKGHRYTPENTVVYRGGRCCRECNRQRHRKRMAERAGTCLDCGEPLSAPTAKRCRSCHLAQARPTGRLPNGRIAPK